MDWYGGYAAAFKLKVIDYALENGNRAAGRHFRVDEFCVLFWRRQLGQLKPTNKTHGAFRGPNTGQYPQFACFFYQALFTSVVSSECLLILRCYVAAKKFRSVHKYGKRRKAWNKGQTTAAAVPVAVPDGACSSSVTEPLLRPFADCCEAESVEGATSSYVRPPDAVDRDGRSREPDCGGTASAAVATPGVRASNILSRVSAQIPSSEEIAQRAQTGGMFWMP
ncbi:hypothetical protein HPB51_011016 [Rhipicephalus microplus]|uniref:Uncharacterized protein n=1 Tax=Rhipicephalus microplus TaxID=6941 RepID=A0A9J6ENG7_RHIMP|nr:hypothetical protein HPB51_011016 [Rhipicephalus microplus]